MSTILKALRRLEREKSAYEPRPLQDEIAAVGPLPSRRRFPLVGVMAATAALGLGLGASLLWLWPRAGDSLLASASGTPPPPAVAAPAVPSAPPIAVAQPVAPEPSPAPVLEEPEPVAAPVASAPPPQAFASPVEVVERPAASPAVEPAPAPPAATAAVAPAPAATPESPPKPGELPPFDYRSRTAQKAPSAPAPAPAERPLEVAKLESPTAPAHTLARSQPVAGAKPPAPAPAQPVRRKPPPEKIVRANLPDVFVSSTVWHPQKDRRLAKVSLSGGVAKDLHEGDAIGPLVVSKIEPSGVIFVHDGVELRRRVGAKN